MSLTRTISLASEVEDRLVNDLIDDLAVTMSQEFEGARGAAGSFQQTFALRIFAHRFQELAQRSLQFVDAARRRKRIWYVCVKRSETSNSLFSRETVTQPSRLSDRAAVLVQPAERIFLVVEFHRLFGQLERVLGIEHDGQFFGALRIFARHDRARMRPVRNPARMQRDRAGLDAFAGTKISAHIEEDLVGFNVVVNPRDLHRFGMRNRAGAARRCRRRSRESRRSDGSAAVDEQCR